MKWLGKREFKRSKRGLGIKLLNKKKLIKNANAYKEK